MNKDIPNTSLALSLETPRNPRYLSLDIWRGIACLTIVFYHSAIYLLVNPDIKASNIVEKLILSSFSMMWIGVPMFFVISGYCIAATSDSIRRKPYSVKEFFLRRFKRIFPPYWIMVVLSLLLILLVSNWPTLFDRIEALNKPETLSISQWIGGITLTEEWRFQVFGGERRWFATHAWSLSYEEQFYAVCGLLLFLAPAKFFPAIIVITIITFTTMLINFKTGSLPVSGFFLDGRWLLFALGILVYYQVNYASKIQMRLIYVALGLSILFTILIRYCSTTENGIVVIDPHNKKLSGDLVVSTTFALVISILHKFDERLMNSKILKPIKFCGIMCYSLYLINWPIANVVSHALNLAGIKGIWAGVFIVIPVTAGISIWLSWLFYLSVERYFLNSPTPVTPKTTVPATVPSAVLAGD